MRGAPASLSEHSHLPSFAQCSQLFLSLSQHWGYSHHHYCHAFTLTPQFCLWRNSPKHGISSCWGSQIPSWKFKKWPLSSKHNLHYKCVALASCTYSSQHMTLMWPQTPLVLSFGKDLRDLGRARLTSSQDGLLFPRSEATDSFCTKWIKDGSSCVSLSHKSPFDIVG